MPTKFLLFLLLFCSSFCFGQTYESYIKRAEAAFGKDQFDSCVIYFNNAFKIAKADGKDLYNAAVCNTINGNKYQAFLLLKTSLNKGINVSKLRIDPDLEQLHQDKKWKKLLKKAKKAQKKEFAQTRFPREAAKLAELWEKDQYWRFRLGKAYQTKDTALSNALWAKMRISDSNTLRQFESVIDRIGWPTESKVGKRGANTAFLIIDHAPREIMEKYFPLLEQAANAGDASMSAYATMKDRVLVNRGKKQIYGTQKYWDAAKEKFVFFPIEDEKTVNAKRKQVGLDPLPDLK